MKAFAKRKSTQGQAGHVAVFATDETLAGLTPGHFSPGGEPSPLALAYISPHADFARVTAALRNMAGATKVVAVSTAGELCVAEPGQAPYCEANMEEKNVILQILPADLIAARSVWCVPLPDHDILAGMPILSHRDRIEKILEGLDRIALPFRIDARDTIALTFIDGLSACENFFMEAVYHSARFPCLFIGGSAGGKPDFRNTYIFDGQLVRQDHAVIVFLKLRPGRGYGVLKSQNFAKTSTEFVVIEAEADRRIVKSVIDPASGSVQPFLSVLAKQLGVAPQQVLSNLEQHTFGVEINGETFVRSVSGTDGETGCVSFYCDVNSGDTLQLLRATDFVAQTKDDVTAYLQGNPPALGAILNDCLLRRSHNGPRLDELEGLWTFPVAGFSTFGELFGINVNETLSALFFFDTQERQVCDDYVENFPIHYAQFCNYFTQRDLNRLQVLGKIHQKIINHLVEYVENSMNWGPKIELVLNQMVHIRNEIQAVRTIVEQTAVQTDEAQDPTAMSDEFSELAVAMKSIRRILESIDAIATHTNMLSLNATIEAARAGTAGRGFAVVAQEVRNLAQRTKNSLSGMNASIQAIEDSLTELGRGIDALKKNQDSTQYFFQNVVGQIGKIVESSRVMEHSLQGLEQIVGEQRRTLSAVHADRALLAKLQ